MTGLACGIVGLPNVGKSTLFNALTQARAASSNYPFCTIDPNIGLVDLVDPRLDRLAALSKSEKIVYAPVRFVDIAGLVKGASQGEGLGNQFLAHIRETDAIVHLVRCFEDPEIIHVEGKINPLNDIATINLELILSDLQSAESIFSRLGKQAKGNKELLIQLSLLEKVMAHLNKNQPLYTLDLSIEELSLLKPYPFLTQKKVLYVANVAETDLPAMENPYVTQVREYAAQEGNAVVAICCQLEAELSELAPEEKAPFLASLGLQESGLNRLIKASFALLDLITFLTTGEKESRAWTLRKNSTAEEAAGKIHTDIQKGFIRAEVISYEDFIHYGGRAAAREAGKLRMEGRKYLVQDGDVMLFLHS